jgi:hypothetical protein
MSKRKNRKYTDEFKREAVRLVTVQGYKVAGWPGQNWPGCFQQQDESPSGLEPW